MEFGPWPRGSITGAQYLALVSSSFLAVGLFEFPADLAEAAGHAGLFALLINTALVLTGTAALLALSHRFPGWTVTEYAPMILGRWPGRIMVVALVGVHLFVTATALEAFTRTIRNVVLPLTPSGVVAALLLGVSLYLALLGLPSLSNTCQVAFPLAWLVLVLVNLVALQRVQGVQMIPSLAPGWGSVFRGVHKVFYPFVAFETLYLLPAFLANRRRLNLAFWGVGLNGFAFLTQFLVVVGTLGLDTTRVLTRPTAFMMRIIRFPGFLVEHLGYVIVVALTVFNCLFAAIQIWAISLAVARLLGLPRERYRLFALPAAAVIFLMRLLFKDEHQLSLYFTNFVSPVGLGAGVLLPAVLLLLAHLRGFKPPLADATPPAHGTGSEQTPEPGPGHERGGTGKR